MIMRLLFGEFFLMESFCGLIKYVLRFVLFIWFINFYFLGFFFFRFWFFDFWFRCVFISFFNLVDVFRGWF